MQTSKSIQSSIGIISKNIIDVIIPKLKEKTKSKQWKNTNNVIKQFNKINNKNSSTFIKFDIKEFYLSIIKNLLLKSIEFAKKYTKTTSLDMKLYHTPARHFLYVTTKF